MIWWYQQTQTCVSSTLTPTVFLATHTSACTAPDWGYQAQISAYQVAAYQAGLYQQQRAMAEVGYARHRARQKVALEAHGFAARKRAREWLLSLLTPDQREVFQRNKWFVVEGGKTKRRYRIRADNYLVANIDVLDGDVVTHRLCAHSDLSELPLEDHLVAQKLMLESDEDEFLKIANRHAA